MKKHNKTKILLAIGALGLASIGNAQFAVTNVNDKIIYPAYFGPTGIFTQMMGQMFNSTKAAIDHNTALMDIARKEQAGQQEDRDSRQRAAMGQAAIAADIMKMMPTLEACAAMSRRAGSGGMSSSAASGGSGGGSRSVKNTTEAARLLNKDSQVKGISLANKNQIGTCTQVDSAGGLANCSGTGKFSGNELVPSSDLTYLSLKGNTNNQDKLNPQLQEYANYTLDTEAQDVAKQYIANVVLAQAPKSLTPAQLRGEKGADYRASYDKVMVRLDGAKQAMNDIFASRKAPSQDYSTTSIAGIAWTKNSSKYQELFGMKAPTRPSLMDLLNFTVTNDYLGTPDKVPTTEVELLTSINDKVVLNNFIAARQLNQQENTNLLLSLLLVQSVTPVDINSLNNDFAIIANEKK